jgi:hypothetical protein
MIYELRLPVIVAQMSGATIETVYAKPGDVLKMGSKLIDISVDLSSAFSQECPPISFFRMVMREAAVLRALDVKPGQDVKLEELVAVFSTTPDESLDEAPARQVRVTVAGIVHHEDMWTGTNA